MATFPARRTAPPSDGIFSATITPPSPAVNSVVDRFASGVYPDGLVNFVAAIEWSSTRHRDRVAVVTPAVTRTYGEIDERANGLARALVELGIGKGDRVGICIGNQVEFIETEWAVAKAGAVRVPILVTSSVSDIERY